MRFLKILGWLFVPYIMIIFQWRKIGKLTKVFGSAWAVIALLASIGANTKPAPITTSQQTVASSATIDQTKAETETKTKEISAEKPVATTETKASSTGTAETAPADNQTGTAVKPAVKNTTGSKQTTNVVPKPTDKKESPAPTPTKSSVKEVYYKNCTAVRAAGAAPLHEGEPGYSRKLDRDGDGVACD